MTPRDEGHARLGLVMKALAELGVLTLAFLLAYLLRFDYEPGPADWARFAAALPIAIVAKAVGLWTFGLFGNWWWRYTSVPDLLRIVGAVALATVVTACGTLPVVDGFPRSVYAIDGILSTVLLVGLTAGSRIVREIATLGPRAKGRRVLVIGAGEAGVRLARMLRRDDQLGLVPVGFVDDDPAKVGGWVQGCRVLGTRHDLPDLVARCGVQEVVIAIPSAGRRAMREIVDACKAAGVPFRILPPARDILSGDEEHMRLRRVQIEDLLGRAVVRFESAAVASELEGRTVLVTGAGGSIGSELCRQIAGCAPARLVLIDRYENTLYYLVRELAERYPDVPVTPLIVDVRDGERIAAAVAGHRPDVVFHAAAHKHVPLMEENPAEAVLNNVVGTLNVARATLACGSSRFVFISTDKAIRPTSVMGCTKRVAELALQTMQGPDRTRFIVVRFGNVLGSEGSVVPLFSRQIARGGPVTVTHPDAVRYFMLIPEAVHLVLHTVVLGRGGEIFFLNMGEPVRVLDLAIDMIRLSGYRPYEDIDIKFTGLRPGEKLAEELWADGEELGWTAHPGIRVLKNGRPAAWTALAGPLAELERAARRDDAAGVRAWLRKIVPEYTGVRPGDVAVLVDEPGTAAVAAESA